MRLTSLLAHAGTPGTRRGAFSSSAALALLALVACQTPEAKAASAVGEPAAAAHAPSPTGTVRVLADEGSIGSAIG